MNQKIQVRQDAPYFKLAQSGEYGLPIFRTHFTTFVSLGTAFDLGFPGIGNFRGRKFFRV